MQLVSCMFFFKSVKLQYYSTLSLFWAKITWQDGVSVILAAAAWVVFRRLVSELFTNVDVDACSVKKTGLVPLRFRFEFCASASVSSPFFAFLLKNLVADSVCLAWPYYIFNVEKRELLVVKTNFFSASFGCRPFSREFILNWKICTF